MAYVIIGNSAAGISAGEALRESDKTGEIVIISQEDSLPYYKYLLCDYISERLSHQEMLFKPREFYREKNIIPFLGEKVIHIDTDEKKILFENREFITYDKLLIASGVYPVTPKIPGHYLTAVYTLRSWEDAEIILQTARRSERAVVMGGDITGYSVAHALLKLHLKVTLITDSDRILPHSLDERGSELIRDSIQNPNLEIIFKDEVEDVVRHPLDNKLVGVGLSSGKEIVCQLLVLDKGIKADASLVRGTGIKFNHGIEVNDKMETTVSSVYAAGDVAETWNIAFEEKKQNEGWYNAVSQGWVAGCNMAGTDSRYPGTIRINRVNFGVPFVSAGLINPNNEDLKWKVMVNEKSGSYRKLLLKNGMIYGMIFIGDTKGADSIIALIKAKAKMEESTVLNLLI